MVYKTKPDKSTMKMVQRMYKNTIQYWENCTSIYSKDIIWACTLAERVFFAYYTLILHILDRSKNQKGKKNLEANENGEKTYQILGDAAKSSSERKVYSDKWMY